MYQLLLTAYEFRRGFCTLVLSFNLQSRNTNLTIVLIDLMWYQGNKHMTHSVVSFIVLLLQASPENVYTQMAQNLLYPSTTYSNVSGGTPLSILDLTVSLMMAVLL